MEEDEGFYTKERWDNWEERIADEDLDPEDEEGALLFFNLQDDVTIACTKVVEAYDDGSLDEDECLDEIQRIRDIVMDEPSFDDPDKEMLLEGVQTSFIGVLASCEAYVTNERETEGDAEDYIRAAIEAEQEDDIDRALGFVSEAGAKIIEGDRFDVEEMGGEVEYGFVSEWMNGLDSLQDAVSEPETIEE